MVTVVSLSERPELLGAMWELPSTWPPFMLNDPVGSRLFPRVPGLFPEYQLLALDARDRVVGRIMAVPFAYAGSYSDLPDRGWDAILESAVGTDSESTPTAVSLLEARVSPDHQGQGLSRELLAAARCQARRLGFRDLFGPVRPTGKAMEPRSTMEAYVARRRPDGLPVDPWLRVHARLGGRVVRICPVSMTVPGTVAQWREWTGLPLEVSGLVEIPGALVSLHVSVEHDHCVYVEPNVWVHHRL